MPFAVLINAEPVELTPGVAFTTHALVVTTPEEAAWTMQPIGSVIARDIVHSPEALANYTDEDLARFLIQKFDEGAPAPDGHQIASRTLAVHAGEISVAVTYEVTPPPPVPDEVTRMQAMAQLLASGRLAAVNAAVAAASAEVQLWFANTAVFRRDNAMLLSVAETLGWPSDDLDALFRAAALIAV